MIYVKGLEKNNGKRLVRADGSIAFNASPEEYHAEGWTEYVQDSIGEGTIERDYRTEQEVVDNLRDECLHEIDSYFDTISRSFYVNDSLESLSLEEHLALLEGYRNTLKSGITHVILQGTDFEIADIIKLLEDLSIYWLQCKIAKVNAMEEVRNFKTKKELLDYDYTLAFPSQLHFNL